MSALMVDTNLLVLLIVGLTAEPMIGRHKRTREYDSAAFRLLLNTIDRFTTIVVSGHALAESSNLLRQCAEPFRTELGGQLATLIGEAREETPSARSAIVRGEYLRLGLTDAAMLEAQGSGATLLTDDSELYLASLAAGRPVINFAHLREAEI